MTTYWSVWTAGDYILYALGIKAPTAAQRRIMAAWVLAEGGQVEDSSAGGSANNPLNTTDTSKGGVNGYVVGASSIPSFSSLYEGALAAADTVHGTFYSFVLQGIEKGDINLFSSALVASPWASGHYGGDQSYFVKIANNLPPMPAKVAVPPLSPVTGQPEFPPLTTTTTTIPQNVVEPPDLGAAWSILRDSISQTVPKAANVIASTKQRIIDASRLGGY